MAQRLNGMWAAWLAVAAAAMVGSGPAQATAPGPAAEQAAPVYTRARLVSTLQESGGRLYVRLQLVPGAKIPFSTLAFRVADPALLAGIPDGAWVKFTARHLDGENTVTSIRMVEPCKRFQPCD